MIINTYYENIQTILQNVMNTQEQAMDHAARRIAGVIQNDGIIYIFGCGHSHLVALDCFYRAGGLGNVCPVLDSDLMLHDGAVKSSVMEKMNGITLEVIKRYSMTESDVFICISTSGKNAGPVEAVKTVKRLGVFTIGITSFAYRVYTTSEHLCEISDLPIDNCVPYGDAVIELKNQNARMGSLSTFSSAFIIQSILMEASGICADKNVQLPIYMSGNVPGGSEQNLQIVEKYISRIKHL